MTSNDENSININNIIFPERFRAFCREVYSSGLTNPYNLSPQALNILYNEPDLIPEGEIFEAMVKMYRDYLNAQEFVDLSEQKGEN